MPSTIPSKSTSLLPYKLWYLFYFAAQFTQLFLPLILDRVMNFSPSTIGYMMGCRRLVIFFVAPIFTWICDLTLLHRILLTIAHTSYYFCTFILSRVRSIPAVLAVIIFREAFISGCEPSVNNAAIAKIEEVSPDRDSYGKLRLWGSLGWGSASVLGSFAIDHFFAGNLVIILYLQIIIGVGVVSLTFFGLDLNPDLFIRQTERKRSTGVVLDLVLRSPRAIFCAISVLVQGIVLGVLQMTIFIYFSSLGVSTSALGLSVFLSCGAEALLFFYDTKIWDQFGGPQSGFNIGLVASSVALAFYSLIQFSSYPTICFIMAEVFNGAIYALFFTSALAVTNEMAPPSLATSSQGALSSLYCGIGPAIGAVLSGVTYEAIGAPALYCILAVLQIFILCVPLVMGIDLSYSESTPSESIKDLELAEATSLLPNAAAKDTRPVREIEQI